MVVACLLLPSLVLRCVPLVPLIFMTLGEVLLASKETRARKQSNSPTQARRQATKSENSSTQEHTTENKAKRECHNQQGQAGNTIQPTRKSKEPGSQNRGQGRPQGGSTTSRQRASEHAKFHQLRETCVFSKEFGKHFVFNENQ